MQANILIVEDDVALAELLQWNCRNEGYDVRHTADGEEAMVLVREDVPDAIILDWMIENLSGIEVCRRLRMREESAQVPILMLTARGEEEDRIRGLKTGADDYLTKPFSTPELMARLEALLRRSRPALGGKMLIFGDLELDPASHRIRRGGDTIHIGPTEYKMLLFFMERPNRVHSRQQLIDAIWGNTAEIDERTIDVHVRRLRQSINRPGDKDLISTVRGAGYILEA